MSTILVTGGAGYIGTHSCVELLGAGHRVVVVDNLVNSNPEAVKRVERITGKTVEFHKVDLLDKKALADVFARQPVDAVIHFAGLKAVGESVQKPLLYYQNNLIGTINLLEVMTEIGLKRLVFSSSATVYGDPERIPLTEDCRLATTNPYGNTKLFIEDMCRDLVVADPSWRIILLRYFNPVGAHESGVIGENPKGIPNNLMPYLLQVAAGKRDYLSVYGNDYPTHDGTGVRDFIHVVDLALGHLAALKALDQLPGCTPINLGTGRGYSVLDLVKALSATVGRALPYRFVPRRPGDIGICYSDPSAAKRLLGWTALRTLDDMCRDGWRWQSLNPDGYVPPK